MRAARGSDLHEAEFPLITRRFLEEPLDCQEAFENSFGVVDAIDANPHKSCLHAEAAKKRGAFKIIEAVVAAFCGVVVGEINAYREGTNNGAMFLPKR